MKLVLQIAIGVFIGAFGSQYAFEKWRSHETQRAAAVESQKLAEQKQRRDEQGAKIREMVIQGLRERGRGKSTLNSDEGTLRNIDPTQRETE